LDVSQVGWIQPLGLCRNSLADVFRSHLGLRAIRTLDRQVPDAQAFLSTQNLIWLSLLLAMVKSFTNWHTV